MSLVVFPFKEEELGVIASNMAVAARHDRVDEVWAVAAVDDAVMRRVAEVAHDIASTNNTRISVFAQERIGTFRSGKGDGMNTAIARAAQRGFARVHFYDADITNFDASWIDGAERAADRGFGVVRHRFPRAATDAMITWMVTRPGLALHFPDSPLPRFGQPLGGEILLSRDAVEGLASDPFVSARSDWGIDTIITYATSVMGLSIFEHNAMDGKRHALYGSLTDIREMALECLDAVASLAGRPRPDPEIGFESDPAAPVPPDLRQTVAYDLAATRAAVADEPDDVEVGILRALGIAADHPISMDGTTWRLVLPRLLQRFQLDETGWRAAAFRLWVERVIHYTTHVVPDGYEAAMAYLEGTIEDFEETASRKRPPAPPSTRAPS